MSIFYNLINNKNQQLAITFYYYFFYTHSLKTQYSLQFPITL